MSKDSVIDAVAITHLLTTGLTSSNASANLITMTNQALALSAQNAVANQQQGYVNAMSANVQGRNSMFATGISTANTIAKEISSE